MPLFEVALIERKDDATMSITKAGAKVSKKRERLLLAPVAVLAPDGEAAKAKVLLDNKTKVPKYDEDLLEVLCRPFDE